MVDFPILILVFIVAFLLGSLPSGVIIGKVFFKTDIRKQGSGNIGTTNAIRAMGKKGGYTVFLMDFGKGLLSGVLANLLFAHFATSGGAFSLDACLSFAFLGCGCGHIFSPWLMFRGGKGIAVSVGCLFVTFGVIPALIELASFAVVVIASRYVSLGSIVAAALCPFFAVYLFWGDLAAIIPSVAMGLIVIWAHRANIQRLLAGNERRIGDKKDAAA